MKDLSHKPTLPPNPIETKCANPCGFGGSRTSGVTSSAECVGLRDMMSHYFLSGVASKML